MELVRAAVMQEPGRIEVQEFPLPDPEPGAVLMRVLLSGVCGTDKHTFRGETSQYAGTEHAREIRFPLICGHENVGVVAALNGTVLASDGHPLEVGDRIVPGANIACGACYFCRNGFRYYLCERLEDYGNSLSCAAPPHLFGGWAEYMYLLPASRVFRVPEEVPDEVAVLTEVMAVTHGLDAAASALRSAGGPGSGHSVVVMGLGPLGLCHLIKARVTGAGELIAIDRFAKRLEMAAAFGTVVGIDAEGTSFEERRALIEERTGGRGADVVVDCTGAAGSFPEALRLARVGGVVVEAGAFVDVGSVAVNPAADICTRDLTVIGIGGERAEDYPAALALMASHRSTIPLERIVTHRFALDDAMTAIEVSATADAMKVVFEPGRS